jgi:DNA invertase Pin-like site-specific DNA recombinase
MPTPNYSVRAYVAALGYERIIPTLTAFVEEHDLDLVATYVEDDAGQTFKRPELLRMLTEAKPYDMLLCDRVKRLGRLKAPEWQELRRIIREKRLRVIALDVPGSWAAMDAKSHEPNLMNELLLDILGAVSSRQHEERLRKAQAGIDKAKADGKYKGRVPDAALHERIKLLLAEGVSIRKIATVCDCAKSTVQAVKSAQAAG